eukprot:gene11529-34242_t
MDWNNPKTGIAFCGTIAAICNAAAFIHAISRKHERLGSVHEGRLLGLKIFRTLSYATLAISEGLILLLYLASDWSDRPLMSVQKLSAAVSWTIGVVSWYDSSQSGPPNSPLMHYAAGMPHVNLASPGFCYVDDPSRVHSSNVIPVASQDCSQLSTGHL